MPKPVPVLSTVLAVTVALSGTACATGRSDRDPRYGTGFISKTLCDGVFVSRLDPRQVYEDTIRPLGAIRWLAWAFHHDVDRTRREVRTTLAGAFETRAIHREELGCLIVRGTETADSRRLIALERPVSLLPEIAGASVVEPSDGSLRVALDRAFAEPSRPPSRRTKAVVVVHGGRVVAERYAPGYGVETRVPGYSDTKSVVSALVGVLVREGRLSVDQPAPIPTWRAPDDPRRAITIDHLLRMTSGLAWAADVTAGGPDNDRMTYVEPDMAAFAASRPLATSPGTAWRYSNSNTMILSRIIRDAVGGGVDDVLRFAHRELFGPLGMRSVTLEFDASGTPVGSGAMLATARDWARFGMLYLNDGVVGERRILPEGWVRYSSAPTPTAPVGYGAGFWTNVGGSRGAVRRRGWGMPADSFFASGWLGQLVVVVPSAQVVVARFGASHGPLGDHDGVSRLVGEVVEAVGPISRQREEQPWQRAR